MSTTYTVRIVTARKDHRCDEYPRCPHGGIRRGQQYQIHTEFPGGEAGYADSAGHPVSMKFCPLCLPIEKEPHT